MHVIEIHEPVVTDRRVRFSWTLEPPLGLYARNSFEMAFPPSVDLSAVPMALWWRVGLICLHAHWPLLRPCRVVLPVTLPPGEREFWLRLTDAAVSVLDSRGDTPRAERSIELVDGGPPLEAPAPPVGDRLGIVSCFSGGRDSLSQAGLLAELGEQPILVTTTSPVTWSTEHDSARRRQVLDRIVERGPYELVEVQSDLRGNCDNSFASPYGVSVNELGDCFLYAAAAIAVAAARGARIVLIASEAEVQESVRRSGMVVQHMHFMYSAATHRALSALCAPFAIAVGSLTYPLRQFQVQELLAARYPNLSNLQYSCWSLGADEAACSRCIECRNNALNLMALGRSPTLAGIDLVTLLLAADVWERTFGPPPAPPGSWNDSPSAIVGRSLRYRAVATLSSISVERVAQLLDDYPERSAADRAAALASFQGFHQRAADQLESAISGAAATEGYRAGYLELLDERLRPRVASILNEHFEPAPRDTYEQLLENSRALGDWIGAPLSPPAAGRPRGRRGAERAVDAARERTPSAHPPAAVTLDAGELARIARLLPDPEPPLGTTTGHVKDVLHVSDMLLDGNELAYVTEAVRTNWISSAGSYVSRFEEAFAAATGCRFAVACSSGTTALHLALSAAGIGDGDEVLLPTFTMIATANAVRYVGAEPVLLDAEGESWNLAVDGMADKLSPRTRAIVVMHTYGNPVDMDAVEAFAASNGLVVIEDAAEAHGARHRDRPVGSIGDVGAFSFYGNKIVTTGEGGAVVTNDDAIAAVARSLRDHAFSPERHFWHQRVAFNYRMSNLQAAVGLAQIERLEQLIAARRATASAYREALDGIPGLGLTPASVTSGAVPWMFGITVGERFGRSRDELRRILASQGIETRTFFIPIHLQPIYRERFAGQSYPVAEELGRTGLYVPSGTRIDEEDIAYVANAIRDAHEQSAPTSRRTARRAKPVGP
jgi:perosamine synthetase